MRLTPLKLAVILTLLTTSTIQAQTGLRAAPSTRGTAEVTLMASGAMGGEATPPKLIRLDYGQPHLRGRTLLVDSLVPYDAAWRLGANATTTLHTDVGLTLGGSALEAGTYELQAIPTRAGWTLTVARITGTDAEGANILAEPVRIVLQHRMLGAAVESLSMWLIPSTESGPARGELRFAWGTHQLSVDWVVR